MISNILTISKFTLKEILQSRILYNVVFLGLFLILITFVAYSFTYGEPARVALDFGLGTLSFSSELIALFIGANLLSDEIKNKTLHLILTRPVSRYEFLLGKYLGLLMFIGLNTFILSSLTLSLYFLIGGQISMSIFHCLNFILVEALIIMVLSCLLSLLVSKPLVFILSFVLYFCGQSIELAMQTSLYENSAMISFILDGYHYFLPAYYKLNLKPFILYSDQVSKFPLFETYLYGLMYLIGILLVSLTLFKRKNIE